MALFVNDGDPAPRGGGAAPSAPSAPPASAPAPASVSASGAMPSSSGAMTFSCEVTRVSAAVPGRAPDFPLLPGDEVYVAPVSNNATDAFASVDGPAAAINGPRMRLAPSGNPVQVHVRNVADIFCFGTAAADAVRVMVLRKAPQS